MNPGGSSYFSFESASPQRSPETGNTARSLRDAAFMLIVILVLAVFLFSLVLLFRRPLRRVRRLFRSSSEPSPHRKHGDYSADVTRRRRRRRSHHMNPSRAQTGGLPPKRKEPPLGPANT